MFITKKGTKIQATLTYASGEATQRSDIEVLFGICALDYVERFDWDGACSVNCQMANSQGDPSAVEDGGRGIGSRIRTEPRLRIHGMASCHPKADGFMPSQGSIMRSRG